MHPPIEIYLASLSVLLLVSYCRSDVIKQTEIFDDMYIEKRNCECGVQNTVKSPSVHRRKRIVSNTVTWPNQKYPWVAQIRVDDVHICGAVIISTNYLLTAAHCGDSLKTSEKKYLSGEIDVLKAYIAVGTQSKDSAFVQYPIIKLYMHPHYRDIGEPMDDIAVVKVKNPIAFSDRIGPICLPSWHNLERPGKYAKTLGWGAPQRGETSAVLKDVWLPIRKNEDCLNTTREEFRDRLNERVICAGGFSGLDSCMADSGGPLQARDLDGHWFLIGLVSFGYEIKCGSFGNPGVYIRVSSYMDWIFNKTSDSLSCKARDFIRMEPNLQECGLPAEKFVITNTDDYIGDDLEPITELEYPWMAKIYREDEYLGTGILINTSTILTTTEVINPWIPHTGKKIYVALGNSTSVKATQADRTKLHLFSTVQSIIFHPLGEFRFKLVLLRLRTTLADATEPFHPICFTNGKFIYLTGDDLVTVKPTHDSANTTLEDLDGQLIGREHCEGAHPFQFPSNRVLCARIYDPIPGCPAKGGLPLLQRTGQRMYLLGLANNVDEETDGCIKVADDVNYALPWIRRTISFMNLV